MADPTPVPATDPNAKGSKTTEGRLNIAAFVSGVCAVLAGVVVALQGLRDAFPGTPWIAGVLAIAGTVLQIAVALGYSRDRTGLKVEQVRLAQEAGQRAADRITTNEDVRRALEGGPSP